MFNPVLKWSGSKRSQSFDIISHFPKEIKTYYEPFVGGGSVLRALLDSDIQVEKYVCSDNNIDLIQMWQAIKNNPKRCAEQYRKHWLEMNVDGNDEAAKRTYYEGVRKRYNEDKSPYDFMFLNRTCFNGLIRYNSKGEFNSPFHLNRPGIHPDKFEAIVNEWSKLLNDNDVRFLYCDYKDVKPEQGDFVYCDPPYANTKGMYSEGFNNEEMFKWLGALPCSFALSYDGKSGEEDKTYNVPDTLYDEHYYMKSGNSSYKRIKEVSKDSVVYESLYVKKR